LLKPVCIENEFADLTHIRYYIKNKGKVKKNRKNLKVFNINVVAESRHSGSAEFTLQKSRGRVYSAGL